MRFVFFCHPAHMRSQSMPRFARMVGESVAARGQDVQYWAPGSAMYELSRRFKMGDSAAKWASYIDQYLIFPMQVRWRLRRQASDTLFVFCDQALGPWVPLVRHRPHVVHAHDLLALRSALGLISENPISMTGQVYQRYIRQGFRQARHFICVSRRTMDDLRSYGEVSDASMRVVYNGLNYPYRRVTDEQARLTLQRAGLPAVEVGLILHVGGGQWYKNTAGVIHLYGAYASQVAKPLPLWMISPQPASEPVLRALVDLPPGAEVRFFQGVDNETLQALYSLSSAMLFPSLAEGFGWPLIEAQACGCPVLTTNDTPMSEVAGPHASYLPRLQSSDDMAQWAQAGGRVLAELVNDGRAQQADKQAERMAWAAGFTSAAAMEGYWRVYMDVLNSDDPLKPIAAEPTNAVPSP